MRKKFDATEYVGRPEKIADHLNHALATGGLEAFMKAIGIIARAHGASRLTREVGISRQRLYRGFDGTATPQVDTVFKLLSALGVELVAEPKG
jgi:probable addiction module antidote protein